VPPGFDRRRCLPTIFVCSDPAIWDVPHQAITERKPDSDCMPDARRNIWSTPSGHGGRIDA
jgi:hypothetical protein